METLTRNQLVELRGGGLSGCGAVSAIGMAACTGASFWPIGTLIFGPTCLGMIIGVATEC